MTLSQRLRAAADAMLGRIPPQKGFSHPYFWGGFISNAGMPQDKPEMNYQRLRKLSETPIPRRAIRYIKSQVSRLECGVVVKQGVKATAKQKKVIDSLNSVFQSPNGEDTWKSMLERWVEDMLVCGWSTTVVKNWSEHPDHPMLLFPSDAASFQVYLDWNGSPQQRKYAQWSLQGDRVDFLPGELFVIKYDPRTSDPFGLPPMAVANQEIEYLLAAMGYAGNVASQAHPKKLLHLGEDADPEFVKEVRMYWRDEVEGRGTLPILGGTKAPTSIELGADSDQSLFIQWQDQLIKVIANAFGIDVQKFGVVTGVNRSTGDQMDDTTDESAIRPIATMIENSINDYFLRQYGIYEVAEFKFKFTTSATDKKALAVVQQIMLQDDTLTVNEARAEQGYLPLPVDAGLGMSPGDLTLTGYRAYMQAKFGPIAGVGKVPTAQDFGQQNSPNKPDTSSDLPEDQKTDAQKGKNGVHGSPTPKNDSLFQGKDLNTDEG